MKALKSSLAAVLCLLLLLAAAPGAYADMIFPAPEPVQAGSELNHHVATLNADVPISVMEESFPAGVSLYTEFAPEGQNIYLRGVPLYAGNYNCIFSAGDASLSCPLTVEPAYPFILGTSGDVDCALNDPVQLEVSAYTLDGGVLSYQWYLGQFGSGAMIGDGSPLLSVGTTVPGTSYYYCVVTNTNNGFTASTASPVITVNVGNSSQISWVSLYSQPYKTTYSVGETLDTTGLQLSVGYTDGSSEVISSGFYVDSVQLSGPGVFPVSVYFEGYSCSFNVTVGEQAEVVSGIGVLTLPTKTRYTVGETLDTTGLSIRAYNNSVVGYRDVGREFLTCSPSVLNTTGEQEILVVFGDKTCTFTVSVEGYEQPETLMVATMPNRVTYTVGDSLDATGLVLKQISTRQNTQLIYSGYTCTPIQLNTVGRQQITVYYGNLSTTFTVTVTAASAVVTPSPTAQLPAGSGSVTPSMPTSVPTALPSSAPTASPTVMPTLTPTMPPRASARSGHQSNLGRSLISVIVITSVIALAVLGAYVFVMNQGGLEGAEQRLRELFSKSGNKKDRRR
ncbi:MAG: bacterial Ig-like domain-containing protein [Eubacteriales bacterium]|nr:bacterial Ig-like domain-containing protein [Eubacteriales bacterium]